MYQQLLDELRASQARYGELPQPPCPDNRLARLQRRVRDELGADLPDEYVDLLRGQDGLNHNGLFIYGSETAPIVGAPNAALQGFVEANLLWRDDEYNTDLLVFGDGNIDLYVRHLPTGEYQVRDRVPGNIVERYRSFGDLLAAALKSHL